MSTNAGSSHKQHWFFFYCERCGRDSDADGFLLDADYADLYPCLSCQGERDVETPMTFRPATKDEELRLEKREGVRTNRDEFLDMLKERATGKETMQLTRTEWERFLRLAQKAGVKGIEPLVKDFEARKRRGKS
jgi:hypothetical protein